MAPTLPSIARRLAWTLLAAALASSIAVSLAVWLAVRHEVDELLDDTLQGAAEAMRPHLAHEVPHGAGDGIVDRASNRYAWQVVEHGPDGQARVVQRSSRAPGSALSATPCAGFADRPGWRVFGTAIGRGIVPNIPVAFGIGAAAAAFLEPGVLVRGVVGHQVDDELEAASVNVG